MRSATFLLSASPSALRACSDPGFEAPPLEHGRFRRSTVLMSPSAPTRKAIAAPRFPASALAAAAAPSLLGSSSPEYVRLSYVTLVTSTGTDGRFILAPLIPAGIDSRITSSSSSSLPSPPRNGPPGVPPGGRPAASAVARIAAVEDAEYVPADMFRPSSEVPEGSRPPDSRRTPWTTRPGCESGRDRGRNSNAHRESRET
jgi:hypothetical protein